MLYDRSNWFQTFQQTARQPYPEALRHAILAKNYPLLMQNISSYLHQLEITVTRDDLVSLNLGFITENRHLLIDQVNRLIDALDHLLVSDREGLQLGNIYTPADVLLN
ncbi:hypothetical protein [Leptolyngbya sp. FACHB-36]|uniref:hypothetical protein n=1 Tax=Leptolyngbya sp. FACHB-36 TaxID=2692808 RepID=UPI0016801994|nr:hypothetical protein [Leptolyngbya sp. FACHB-36]